MSAGFYVCTSKFSPICQAADIISIFLTIQERASVPTHEQVLQETQIVCFFRFPRQKKKKKRFNMQIVSVLGNWITDGGCIEMSNLVA